ncbi:MAG: PEGA domain-containing protein [Fibromonadales bacterium]|nr:PEGA domain-containing protein [Fibromonadales bacterium]
MVRTVFLFLAIAFTAFSQEVIKFKIPVDSTGAFIPTVLPQRPDTVQKLGLVGNRPLDLVALSAKDTASFETYSKRLALVQDSISATHAVIELIKKNVQSMMPVLEPRSEFEKQSEYDERKTKWDREFYERTQRDTKSFSMRLTELERAKKKIEENQAAMYSSLVIKSMPDAASIWIGMEEIGATPVEYNYLIPGAIKLSVRKEGYNTWDTTFQATPKAKFMFNVELDEKSIFNQENEINFARFLTQDTTADGYRQRIIAIEMRKIQVGEELNQIQIDFANSYPPLKPQQLGESPGDFNKRRDAWAQGGMKQVAEFQQKHEAYVQKLNRCIAVLNDYIIVAQSIIMSEPAIGAKIELGAYDADKEQFELVAQDGANEKSPFYFTGKVGVPRDTAKVMDRAMPGFAASLQFINFPFVSGSSEVNLAMSRLQLSRGGMDLKVEGSFSEIEQYRQAAGYANWKLRADSLLSGSLKPQGLDYAYAMNKSATKFSKSEGGSGSSFLGWRGWTRLLTFGAAAGLTMGAVFKQININDRLDEIDILKAGVPHPGVAANDDKWKVDYNSKKKSVERNELQRNLFGLAAIGCFAAGGVTFLF